MYLYVSTPADMEAIKAALEIALDETMVGCPYLLQNGDEGAHGPNTCSNGCRDEPACVTNSYPKLPPAIVDWVRS